MLGVTAASLLFASAAATSAGADWAPGGSLPGLGGGRIWSLAASPGTAGLVVAGTDAGVYTSTNSGTSWSATSLKGVRVWAVGFDARDAKRIFAGTDGAGAELSTDGGATWTAVSTGLPDLTVRAFAFGLDGIAAATNKGVALSPDGTSWHDGGLEKYSISALAVAANSPSLVLVAAADRGDLSNGYLFRYSGSGTTWQALASGLPASAIATSVAAGPLSTSVTKRPLIATTSRGMFRSGDGGSTWTASTGVAETLTVTSATFSPLDPNLVYAGADAGGSSGGDLLRSTDGGSSFSASDAGLPTKTREVESIAVEPTTPPLVIAALDPASGGQVYAESDTTAPAPPALVPESPGATVPASLATPTPSARASVAPAATPRPPDNGAFARFVSNVFHWPVPLVFEVLLVLAVAYVIVRWRQRYYVEGPP
jgi:hypothetical protein